MNEQSELIKTLMKGLLSNREVAFRLSADLALFTLIQLEAAKLHPMNGSEQTELIDLITDPIKKSLLAIDPKLKLALEGNPFNCGGMGKFTDLSLEHQLFLLNLIFCCRQLETQVAQLTGASPDSVHRSVAERANAEEYSPSAIASQIQICEEAVSGVVAPRSQSSRRRVDRPWLVGFFLRLGETLTFIEHESHHRREVAMTQLQMLKNVHRKLDWVAIEINEPR